MGNTFLFPQVGPGIGEECLSPADIALNRVYNDHIRSNPQMANPWLSILECPYVDEEMKNLIEDLRITGAEKTSAVTIARLTIQIQ